MKKTLKKYFVPHEENNYHPHILHTKRAFFYSGVFVAMKAVVVAFVLLLPAPAFVLPDILAIEQSKIIAMANDLRAKQGAETLEVDGRLKKSANLKSQDMSEGSYFSHTSPDGKSLAYFLDLADYKYKFAGENLAMGYSDTDELFDAWIKSPTHYKNIVDSDFTETGIGVQAGEYNGMATIYVTQHFGQPKMEIEVAEVNDTVEESQTGEIKSAVLNDKVEEEASKAAEAVEAINDEKTEDTVLALNNTKEVEEEIRYKPVVLDTKNSKLLWEEEGEGMRIFARVILTGAVENAFVQVQEYSIPLKQTAENVYDGDIGIKENKKDFFKAIIPGTIIIKAKDGEVIKEGIDWGDAEIVEPTPIEKYTMAKKRLSPITNIFDVSKNIYLGFLIFFAFALILNIVIEIKKQHHHVILQTIGLLGVLVLFYTF